MSYLVIYCIVVLDYRFVSRALPFKGRVWKCALGLQSYQTWFLVLSLCFVEWLCAFDLQFVSSDSFLDLVDLFSTDAFHKDFHRLVNKVV